MKTFDPQNCNDLLDYFLKQSNDDKSDLFDKDAIIDKIAEMILAATETTSVLLYQGLCLMAKHQKIQENVFEEISEKLGLTSVVCLADRDSLPYTNAVISEIHRFVCLISLVSTHVNRGLFV
ncbi:Cytochrome P450 2C8-like protein [Leptotrombidium deliense]|uniref:Cytochrome P450 2C8-like protein n=1 Tax=Leptotrombidium deliense TaxID=299467 RepID=A0A443RU14_9ACAR|nr:Cytochrome P450 2C8-like protein [Leptotrombidium deliense]